MNSTEYVIAKLFVNVLFRFSFPNCISVLGGWVWPQSFFTKFISETSLENLGLKTGRESGPGVTDDSFLHGSYCDHSGGEAQVLSRCVTEHFFACV